MTVEAEPQIIPITDAEALRGVIHNCGLTCLILDLTLALAPAQPGSNSSSPSPILTQPCALANPWPTMIPSPSA